MKRLLHFVWRAEGVIVACELAVMVTALVVILASIVVNVIARTFNLPVADLSEPALVGMAVLAFIGSAYAVHARAHIAVDLGELIPATGWRPWADWAVDFAVVALSLLILRYGSEFLAYVVSIGEGTPGLDLPLALPVGCLVGGAGLSIFHIACRCSRRLAGAGAGEAPQTEELSPLLGEEKVV